MTAGISFQVRLVLLPQLEQVLGVFLPLKRQVSAASCIQPDGPGRTFQNT